MSSFFKTLQDLKHYSAQPISASVKSDRRCGHLLHFGGSVQDLREKGIQWRYGSGACSAPESKP